MRYVLQIIFVLLVVPAQVLCEITVSIEDLTALEEKGLYQELYEKLEYLPASKRDTRWTKLLQSSSKFVITRSSEDPEAASLSQLRKLFERYPLVHQEREHGSIVRKNLSSLVDACAQSQRYQQCAKDSIALLEYTPQSNEQEMRMLAGDFAKKDAALALSVYGHLILKEGHSSLCEQGHFQRSLIEVLAHEPMNETVEQAQTLLTDTCGSSLLSHIRSELSQQGKLFKKRVCPSLLSSNLISGLQRKRCEQAIMSH